MNTLLEIGLSNALMAAGLAVIALLIGVLCRRPALVHAVWLLVLLKLITPPIVSMPLFWSASEASPVVTLPESSASLSPPFPIVLERNPELKPEAQAKERTKAPSLALQASIHPVSTTSPSGEKSGLSLTAPNEPSSAFSLSAYVVPLVITVWLLGSLLHFAVSAYRIRRFHRLVKQSRPASEELQKDCDRLAAKLRLPFAPRVYLIPGTVSPMLYAFLSRPRLFLPADLLPRLNADERATLLAHELAHVARRDHWVRLIELLATGLYWWNPILWLARRQLHAAEEQCCDAWVVWALPSASRAYADALVHTVEFLSETRPLLPAPASGIGRVHHLRRRLTMIMQAKTPTGLGRIGWLLVIGLGLPALLAMPTGAEEKPPMEKEKSPPKSSKPADDCPELVKHPNPTAEYYQKRIALAELQLEQGRQELELFRKELQTLKKQACLKCHAATIADAAINDSGAKPSSANLVTKQPLEDARDEVEIQEVGLAGFKANIRSAQKEMEVNQSEVKRLQATRERIPGAVTEQDMKLAEARVELAKTKIERAMNDLKLAEIRLRQAKRLLAELEDKSRKKVGAPTENASKYVLPPDHPQYTQWLNQRLTELEKKVGAPATAEDNVRRDKMNPSLRVEASFRPELTSISSYSDGIAPGQTAGTIIVLRFSTDTVPGDIKVGSVLDIVGILNDDNQETAIIQNAVVSNIKRGAIYQGNHVDRYETKIADLDYRRGLGLFTSLKRASGQRVILKPSAKSPPPRDQTGIHLEIADDQDPIETVGQVVYTVKVFNRGPVPVTNLALTATIPPEMTVTEVKSPPDNPAKHTVKDRIVTYKPIVLAANKEAIYSIKVQALKAGDVRFRAELKCDQMPNEILLEEEPTVIFAPLGK